MVTCPECAAELEADAVFCGVCGKRLPRTVIDGRFTIEARIAAGGFATIYRARHRVSGAHVALKLLHGDLARDRALAERFRREAAALAQLRDMHTVTMFEFGETGDGTLFIVMELLVGKSLTEVLRAHGPLAWRRVVEIARGVCSSLSEAHRIGIIHRDIKPANIHLEPRARGELAKVLDFGIAKVPGGHGIAEGVQLTRAGQSVGTIDYMAPEQLFGDTCDGRSDLYSLGVVLYELLVGQRPFADATGPASLVTALITRVPVRPSQLGCDLPVELEQAVLRCLEREPAKRFKTVDELAWVLGQVLERYPEGPPRPQQVKRITPSRVPAATPASVDQPAALVGALPSLDDEDTTIEPGPPPPLAVEPIVRFTPPRRMPEGSDPASLFAQGSTVEPSPMATTVWLLVLLTRDVRIALAIAQI